MSKAFLILILMILLTSCNNKSTGEDFTENQALYTAQQSAMTAGLENWKSLEEIQFTFNVGKMDKTIMSRKWKWNVATQDVQLIAKGDTITYNRNSKLNNIQISTDRAFVNDTYWLLPEFKLAWDEGTSFTGKKSQIAPISKDTLDMITILYNDTAGYTPGDAYDIYYGADYTFKEWTYRSKNDTSITLATTFGNFKSVEGITVATDHRTADQMTRIHFTNIKITKKK
jgi:hypothetical protein